jgi:hypothetical protein
LGSILCEIHADSARVVKKVVMSKLLGLLVCILAPRCGTELPKYPGDRDGSVSSTLVVSDRISCALHDGELVCWGRESDVEFRNVDEEVIAVTEGVWHFCAMTATRRVACFDGLNREVIEFDAPAGAKILQYDEHGRFLCAYGSEGEQCTWTWFPIKPIDWASRFDFGFPVDVLPGAVFSGDPIEGCIADGAGLLCWRNNVGTDLELHRINLPPFVDEVAWLSSDAIHASGCAISESRAVACWLGGEVVFTHPGPAVSALARWSSAADRFACFIDDAGAVSCRGSASWGQVRSKDWTRVDGLPPVRELASSSHHLCARTIENDVYCWGMNSYGESSGTPPQPWEPLAPVAGLPPIAKLAVLGNRTCAEERSGVGWCWGTDGFEREPAVALPQRRVVPIEAFSPRRCGGLQVCQGPSTSTASPVPLPDASWPNTQMRVRGLTHECGLTAEGAVLCRGYNGFGQLGRPDANTVSYPVKIELP